MLTLGHFDDEQDVFVSGGVWEKTSRWPGENVVDVLSQTLIVMISFKALR